MIKSLKKIKVGYILLCTNNFDQFTKGKYYKVVEISNKWQLKTIANDGWTIQCSIGQYLNNFIVPKGKLIKHLYG